MLKPYLAGNFGYVWTPRQLVAVSASHKPLFAPGTKYSYSNTNYILLGLIVEKATGNPIAAELKRRIFAPLGLRSTSLDTSPRMRPPFAHGYLVQGKEPQDVTAVSPSTPGRQARSSRAPTTWRGSIGPCWAGACSSPSCCRRWRRPRTITGSGCTRAVAAVLGRPAHWGHDGAIAGYDSIALNSKDGKQAVILVNSLTLDDKVGSKRAQQALGRLFQNRRLWCLTSEPKALRALRRTGKDRGRPAPAGLAHSSIRL